MIMTMVIFNFQHCFAGGIIVVMVAGDKDWTYQGDALNAQLQSYIDDKICTKWTEQKINVYSEEEEKSPVYILTKT